MRGAPDPISGVLERYEAYEFTGRDTASGLGISGWQCENPFAARLIESVSRAAASVDHIAYSYIEDDDVLRNKILDFHQSVDGVRQQAVLPAAGSNSLLFSFIAYLKTIDVSEVYYIPPLYFALYHAMKLFGIRARPISSFHAFEPEFQPHLPNQKTWLLLSDPIWYAGVSVPIAVIREIAEWQERTGSTVFVDGTFQLMPWSQRLSEDSARLPHDATLRIISPTKSLAIHGYRFAYMLLPALLSRPLSVLHNTIYSSTTAENKLFAHEAMRAVSDRTITAPLIELAQERFAVAVQKQIIGERIAPSCGYFVFAEPKGPIASAPNLLDSSYFEQKRYPNYSRINLLSPKLTPLLN